MRVGAGCLLALALVVQPVAADERAAAERAQVEKFLVVVSNVARSGDLFDAAAVQRLLGVRFRRRTAPVFVKNYIIGQADVYDLIGRATNIWLPSMQYSISTLKPTPPAMGPASAGPRQADLGFSWGALGRCVTRHAARHAFGPPTAVPENVPTQDPPATVAWRWTYATHNAEPLQLDATFSAGSGTCFVGLALSQKRNAASP